ncbi:MAG TPA: hypothetical protein DEB40_06960 [Elusimicrobia bacterium]|nr:hypothetical protein [Elusimicrobiota bacterium]HBT61468.1 hypothetical protein [Elusimicrobiota bacterium]
MKLIVPALAALFVAVMSGVASAEEWKLIYRGPAGIDEFIDASSVARLKNGRVRAWHKSVSREGRGVRALIEVDCKDRKYTIFLLEPLNPENLEDFKTFELITEGWSAPKRRWVSLGARESGDAQYQAWCGK